MEQNKKWYIKASIYTLGLLISGLVGALVRAQTEKADIEVQVTSVRINSPTVGQLLSDQLGQRLRGSGRARTYRANEELLNLTRKHKWLANPNPSRPLENYLISVREIETDGLELASGMKRLRGAMDLWPKAINDATIDVVYDILREHRGIIFGHIFGEVGRNKLIFSGDAPGFSDRRPHFNLEVDGDGDYFIDSGLSRLAIVWSDKGDTPAARERARVTAERIAHALVYSLESDITQLRDSLETIFNEEGTTLQIVRLAQEELETFSYWSVTATLANNGKDAIAVAPRSVLYVNSRGVAISGATTGQEEIGSNLKIPLVRVISGSRTVRLDDFNLEVEYEEETSSPIIIEGGKALSVTFRSLEQIGFLESGRDSLRIFKGPGADSTLTVLPLTASRLVMNGTEAMPSRTARFQDINFSKVFPDNLFDVK